MALSLIEVRMLGEHDEFPDYEGIIDGKLVEQYRAPHAGPNIWNLGGGPEIPFRKVKNLTVKTNCICDGSCCK